MSKSIVTDKKITKIANTIRTKKAITGSMTLDEIPDHIIDLTYTGDANAQSSHILKGHVAFARGEKITGTVEEYDNTYVKDNQTIKAEKVAVAIPSISVSTTGLITATTTQIAGEVAAKTTVATKSLDTQSGQTIIPTTSNQTIPGQKFLTGDIVIKWDSNLTSNNIKKNTTIFNVTGNAASGGTALVSDVVGWKTFYTEWVKKSGTDYNEPNTGEVTFGGGTRSFEYRHMAMLTLECADTIFGGEIQITIWRYRWSFPHDNGTVRVFIIGSQVFVYAPRYWDCAEVNYYNPEERWHEITIENPIGLNFVATIKYTLI